MDNYCKYQIKNFKFCWYSRAHKPINYNLSIPSAEIITHKNKPKLENLYVQRSPSKCSQHLLTKKSVVNSDKENYRHSK